MTPEDGKSTYPMAHHANFFNGHCFLFFYGAVPSQPLNPNVKTVVGSPTELLVTWDPPAESNGIIVIYTIYYYSLRIAENQNFSNVTIQSPLDHVQVLSNETVAVLVGLTPYTFYGCQVTANTSVGEGNFSLLQFNITDESGKCKWLICTPTLPTQTQ